MANKAKELSVGGETPSWAQGVEPLPPWHPDRDTLLLVEVPLYLKHYYFMNVGKQSIVRWAREGTVIQGKRIYLKAFVSLGKRYVTKQDLQAFLDAGKVIE